MKIEFDVAGTEEMKRLLRLLGKKSTTVLGRAMWREATMIMNASRAIVPVKTGVLKASGHVQLPVYDGQSVLVTLGYGGAASAYAEVQHEEESYYHTPPTQYKYLQQPFEFASKGILERLAAVLRATWQRMG